MLQVKILGYWGGFPVNGGGSSSYLIETDHSKILFDMGSASAHELSQQIRYQDLDAIFLSHWHHDHSTDIFTYEHAWKVLLNNHHVDHKLKVFIPSLNDFTKHLKLNSLSLEVIEPNKIYYHKGISIQAVAVMHTIQCFGFKVNYESKLFFYTADTSYFSGLIDSCNQADLLICDATNFKGSNHSSGRGHMSPQEAICLAEQAQVKRVILSHLPSDIKLTQEERKMNSRYPDEWVRLASQIDAYEIT